MSTHHIALNWRYAQHPVETNTYSRTHQITLEGAQTINVSAALEYKGELECADPEQLLLSALASCHMLTFLAIAERQGYQIEQYQDTPTAYLEKDTQGRMAVTRIELTPRVSLSGDKQLDAAILAKLHERAHRHCFIASSITAQVVVTPRFD